LRNECRELDPVDVHAVRTGTDLDAQLTDLLKPGNGLLNASLAHGALCTQRRDGGESAPVIVCKVRDGKKHEALSIAGFGVIPDASHHANRH
jgi:hypothetical protein